MRFITLICVLFFIAGCSPKFNSDPSIPKTWVAINFEAKEKFDDGEREPRGYLSKIIIKEGRNGKINYWRSGHTIILNGMNLRKLETGSIYALTHLRAAGANGAVYVYCGTSDLPAFKVLSSEVAQAGQNIKFSAKRSLSRVSYAGTKISPLSTKGIYAAISDSEYSPEAKSAFNNKKVKKVEQVKIKPSSECGKHNFTDYKIPSHYGLVEMSSKK